MARVLNVSFETIRDTVATLSSSVRSGYGPSFQHTLISTATGNVLITNHGIQILKTVEIKSPCVQIILSSIKGHYMKAGDDTKSFILLLNELVIKSERILYGSVGRRSCHGNNETLKNILKLSQEIEHILIETMPKLLQKLDQYCFRHTLPTPHHNNGKEDYTIASQLIVELFNGALTSHIQPDDATYLSSLLAKFIENRQHSSKAASLRTNIDAIIENQKFIFVENFGKPLMTSTLLPGYLINRGYCNSSSELLKNSAIRFILLGCHIDGTVDDADQSAADYYCDKTNAHMIIQHKRQQAEKFLTFAQSLEVNLLITSSPLSTIERDVCHQLGVATIHAVPEDELNFISTVSNKEILYSVIDLTIENIGNLKKCEEIVLGMEKYVNLLPDSKFLPSSFIVTGSTKSICRQAKNLLLDCLWIVHSSLLSEGENFANGYGASNTYKKNNSCSTLSIKSSSLFEGQGNTQEEMINLPSFCSIDRQQTNTEYLYTIPVGGAFELALHHVINQFLRTQVPGTPGTTILTMLKDALLCLPLQLHTNAYYATKPRWLDTLGAAKQMLEHGHPVGIDAVKGSAVTHLPTHSFPSKCHLIVGVLSTLRQLLLLQHVT